MAVAASRFVCSPEQSWPASDAPEQGDASAAQAGDKAERWALLSLHRDRVVALMRARGVSVEDAEDSVHDAIVQLMAHPALDHRAGSLLTVVAMRRAYDRQRVRMREHRALGRIGRLAEMHVSPADAALDRVEAEWLAGHVGQLPQRQREVVGRRASGLRAQLGHHDQGRGVRTVASARHPARRRRRRFLCSAVVVAPCTCGVDVGAGCRGHGGSRTARHHRAHGCASRRGAPRRRAAQCRRRDHRARHPAHHRR